jgi:hypothetical protein
MKLLLYMYEFMTSLKIKFSQKWNPYHKW